MHYKRLFLQKAELKIKNQESVGMTHINHLSLIWGEDEQTTWNSKTRLSDRGNQNNNDVCNIELRWSISYLYWDVADGYGNIFDK